MKKGRLMTCPGSVSLQVFDAVPTAGLTREDAKALAERIHEIVAAGVAGDEDAGPAPASASARRATA
jgi:hypothetical protein